MLPRFRQLSGPIATIALLVLLAPGFAVDCRGLAGLTGGPMGCCQPADGAGMRVDCCAVGGELPAPERPAGTTATARSSSHTPAAPVLLTTLGGPALPATPVHGEAADTGPPQDRLYIRFAVIRR